VAGDGIMKLGHKYGAKKTIINGIKFDSQAEGKRYSELLLMLKAGLISDIELQPEFVLQPSFTKGSVKYRAIKYRADFAYYDFTVHKRIIEDVKGCRTKEYLIKKKMFEYVFPDLELKEVS
jgi:hypothetical protein